ncbi:MAG: 3-deoxy-7-phosphoheptulonate synthase [Nanoarchaeota archaeon]|nr:3-deoxy-7-phosphoheptulonate synthase [Nanoarchaeota archaeon]
MTSETIEEKMKITDNNVLSYNYDILRPIDLMREYPWTQEEELKIIDYRKQIQNILDRKDNRKIIIIGPCSIHDVDSALSYAERLRPLAEKFSDRLLIVMRTYFEKPRTTIGWPGLIDDPNLDYYIDPERQNRNKGFRLATRLLKAITNIGLPLATEFVGLDTPQYIGDYISWAAIGARTCESQYHKWMASALSMPVGFKNNTSRELSSCVDGVVTARARGHKFPGIDKYLRNCLITGRGNTYSHVVLRGGNESHNFRRDSIDKVSELLYKANIPGNIMVDCSHGNCYDYELRKKVYTKQLEAGKSLREQILDGNENVIGAMYESNLKQGQQAFPKTKEERDRLDGDISITDGCIGWEDSEKELYRWYEEMSKR